MAWLAGNAVTLLLVDFCVANADLAKENAREETQVAWDMQAEALKDSAEALEDSTSSEKYSRLVEIAQARAQDAEVHAEAEELVAETNELHSVTEGQAGKEYPSLVDEKQAEFHEKKAEEFERTSEIEERKAEAYLAKAEQVLNESAIRERAAEEVQQAAEDQKDKAEKVGLADLVALKLLRQEKQAHSAERQAWENFLKANLTAGIQDRELQQEKDAEKKMRAAQAAEVKAQAASRAASKTEPRFWGTVGRKDFGIAAREVAASKQTLEKSEAEEFQVENLQKQAEQASGVTNLFNLNGAADLFLPLFTACLLAVGLAIVAIRTMRLTHSNAGTFALISGVEGDSDEPAE